MFQRTDLIGKFAAVGENTLMVDPFAKAIATQPVRVDGLLNLESETNLFCLNDSVRGDSREEAGRHAATTSPLVKSAMFLACGTVAVDAAAKRRLEPLKHRQMAVRYVRPDGATTLLDDDSDASVGIEQTSGVTSVHHNLRAKNDMQVKSGDIRCPASNGAEGQSRTKQEGVSLLGVRNEHGPAPKGKMCSELYGNIETAAEMIAASALNIGPRVTDCNNKYLYMMVDPRMLYKWSGPRTYPNQAMDTRLCGTRLAFVCTNRMFQGVLDGWTQP